MDLLLWSGGCAHWSGGAGRGCRMRIGGALREGEPMEPVEADAIAAAGAVVDEDEEDGADGRVVMLMERKTSWRSWRVVLKSS